MTNAQFKTLIVVAIFFAVNLLILPWVYTVNYNGRGTISEKPAGYAIFFAPPEPEYDSAVAGVSIDTGRLTIQCLFILVVGGTAFGIVTAKGRKPDSGDRRSKD